MTRLLLALCLILGSSLSCFPPLVPVAPASKCEDSWSHQGTKCYKLFTEKASWEAARLTCACSNSGELVSITSAEENTLVTNTAGDTENTWIGAHDIGAENTFEWTDGTSWSYTNWRENHPNNGGTDGNQDCVSMTTAGEWDDVACGSERQFICEKPDLDQSSGAAVSNGCSCGDGWTPNLDTHKCYKRVDSGTDGLPWAEAESRCKTEGADLASVTSAYENIIVLGMLTAGGNNNNGWLGGSDATTEDTWAWNDNVAFSYTSWWTGGGGQPAGGEVQNCMQMRWADGLWDDVSCSGSKEFFVCKK